MPVEGILCGHGGEVMVLLLGNRPGGGPPRSVGVPSKKGMRKPMVLSQVVSVGVDYSRHED